MARLDYDRAWRADPYDAWATITLVVSATILSVFELRGADLGLLVPEGRVMPAEPWRLFTSALLHGSWFHLLFNLIWTLRFGVVLEALLGTVGFAAAAVALAVGSMAAEWAVGGPAVGLSGIGYGCFGLLFALDRWHPKCRGVLDRQVAELFAVWFLVCLAASHYDLMPVANVAHGAGALLGGLLGWTLAAERRRRFVRGLVTAVTFSALLTLALTPLRHVVNRSDAYAYELLVRSDDAIKREDWAAAAELLEATTARASWAEAWHNLGVCYARLGRHDEADAALERAAASTPLFGEERGPR